MLSICLEIPKIEKHIGMYNIHGLYWYSDQNINLGKIDVCVEVCVASMYNLIRSRVFESYHRMKIILALRSHNGN